MIMLNPRHPAVTGTGLSLKPAPAHPTSVINELSHLRRLARWAEQNGLPHELGAWHDNDLRRLVRDLREQMSLNSVRQYIGTLKMLHRYAPALTGHGLPCDPWAGMSARKAAQAPPSAVVSTPVIPPEQWFPLIRAAWTYVHTLAPDILHARQRYQDLLAQATAMTFDRDIRLNRWLEGPDTPIPVHADSGRMNWSLLTVMLGWRPSCTATLFCRNRAGGRERMARFDRAVANGHPTTTGVIDDLAVVDRGDGTTNAWHPGLSPRAIALELRMLRNACYVLVVALSMMRDSEIHEIAPGSIVEYFGTPAIKSTKGKHDPNLLVKHWWITAPVAEAIVVAEQLSQRDDRLFPPMIRESDEVARSHQMLDAFIGHVNATSARAGLDRIPHGTSRPHMFRRTMAMLTDQFPGSEIALGIQLKHIASRALANRSTQGYANSDNSWPSTWNRPSTPPDSGGWKTSTTPTRLASQSATAPEPTACRRPSTASSKPSRPAGAMPPSNGHCCVTPGCPSGSASSTTASSTTTTPPARSAWKTLSFPRDTKAPCKIDAARTAAPTASSAPSTSLSGRQSSGPS